MVSDIQSKLPPQVAPRVDVVSSVKQVAATVNGQASPTVEPVKKDLALQVPKADIQFDAEKAQKNLDEAIQKLNAYSFEKSVKNASVEP